MDQKTLNEGIGTIFIGLAVTASLYGVTLAQTAWYYRHYPRDRTFLKYLVGIVCYLDNVNLGFYMASVWHFLVKKKLGNPDVPMTTVAQIILNALSVAIIQSFYVFRIWSLSRDKWLTGALSLMVLSNLASSILLFGESVVIEEIVDLGTLTKYDIAMNSVTAATDIFICTALVTLLARSRTGSIGAKRLINRLVFYTINTGMLTTLCSVLTLVTILALPTTSLYGMFYYIGSRMYTVSMLSTLNAREALRRSMEQNNIMSFPDLTSSHSLTRRSTRRNIADTLNAISSEGNREIVVAIQRDTTVTFEEQDTAGKRVYRKGLYRYGKPSANSEPRAEQIESQSESTHDTKLPSTPSSRSL